jgi:uncharacterized membrane protein
VLPPLLTIVILVWILSSVQAYVLRPLEGVAKQLITLAIDKTLADIPAGAVALPPSPSGQARFDHRGTVYIGIGDQQWIPESVYERVKKNPGLTRPQTSEGYYGRYVELSYLKRFIVVPIFFMLFVLLLYLLGRSLAYGIGRVSYNAMESIIRQLPIIRTVYTSVKQVTDFVFSDSEMEFTRVVAVPYPRQGVWSVGFVTGEALRSVREAAGEPVMSVMIPSSPMPATGYTIIVRKSEAVELNISVDQALQFVVSCGVVVPLSQQHHRIAEGLQAAISQHLPGGAWDDNPLSDPS